MKSRFSHAISGDSAWILAGLMLLSSMTAPEVTSARQATPAATPESVTCTTPPRSVEEILALLTPPPGEGTPAPWHEILPLPFGEPADPATVAAITAALREFEACVDTGDELRFIAFFSDDWISTIPKNEDIVAEFSALKSATPIPIPHAQRAIFTGPWHVEILDDGRVLAAVEWFGTNDAPNPDPSRTRVLLFVNHDGRWLLDEIISGSG